MLRIAVLRCLVEYFALTDVISSVQKVRLNPESCGQWVAFATSDAWSTAVAIYFASEPSWQRLFTSPFSSQPAGRSIGRKTVLHYLRANFCTNNMMSFFYLSILDNNNINIKELVMVCLSPSVGANREYNFIQSTKIKCICSFHQPSFTAIWLRAKLWRE